MLLRLVEIMARDALGERFVGSEENHEQACESWLSLHSFLL